MAIQATAGKLHWNYFLALDRDLEVVSRYVEFCTANLEVYSIEFAHLLFAAASEVDVVAKLLCQHFNPGAPRNNINDYRAVLTVALPQLHSTTVLVPRYGLTLTPWDRRSDHPPGRFRKNQITTWAGFTARPFPQHTAIEMPLYSPYDVGLKYQFVQKS